MACHLSNTEVGRAADPLTINLQEGWQWENHYKIGNIHVPYYPTVGCTGPDAQYGFDVNSYTLKFWNEILLKAQPHWWAGIIQWWPTWHHVKEISVWIQLLRRSTRTHTHTLYPPYALFLMPYTIVIWSDKPPHMHLHNTDLNSCAYLIFCVHTERTYSCIREVCARRVSYSWMSFAYMVGTAIKILTRACTGVSRDNRCVQTSPGENCCSITTLSTRRDLYIQYFLFIMVKSDWREWVGLRRPCKAREMLTEKWQLW